MLFAQIPHLKPQECCTHMKADGLIPDWEKTNIFVPG